MCANVCVCVCLCVFSLLVGWVTGRDRFAEHDGLWWNNDCDSAGCRAPSRRLDGVNETICYTGAEETANTGDSAFPPTLLRDELPRPPRLKEEVLSMSVSDVNRTLFISLSEPLLSQSEDRRRTGPPGGRPNGLNLEKLQGGRGWHQP